MFVTTTNNRTHHIPHIGRNFASRRRGGHPRAPWHNRLTRLLSSELELSMRTRLCDLLGIEFPIIQAGMSIHTSSDLVAAVSSAGGLGSLGCWRRSADDVAKQVSLIREKTQRPIALNSPTFVRVSKAERISSPLHFPRRRDCSTFRQIISAWISNHVM